MKAGSIPSPVPAHLPLRPADDDLDRRLIACLMIDSEAMQRVSGIVGPEHFRDDRARVVWDAIREHSIEIRGETGLVELTLLAGVLEDSGNLDAIGGRVFLSETTDLEATSAVARPLAFRIRLRWLDNEIRRHALELARHPDDADALEMLRERVEERAAVASQQALVAGVVGLSGDALLALAAESEPESPLPGYLDPEPSLHLLHGVAKTGKTTMAWTLALAWATGRPPWDGAPPLPGSRVLILSAEQSARKCLRVLRRIARTADLGRFEEWSERVTLVGLRRDTPSGDRRLLRLDDGGLAALRSVLEEAERSGDPFGLVVADSLTRLAPPGCDMNDNDDVRAMLAPLAEIASETGAYVCLIHHAGHSKERKGEPVAGVRGASVIRDIPQALWSIDRVLNEPRLRRLRVAGNELPDLTVDFEVSESHEREGDINRFRPASGGTFDLDRIFRGEAISQNEFGRRALGWAPDRAPAHSQKKKAKGILESLETQGLVRRVGRKWASVEV